MSKHIGVERKKITFQNHDSTGDSKVHYVMRIPNRV